MRLDLLENFLDDGQSISNRQVPLIDRKNDSTSSINDELLLTRDVHH